MAVDAVLAASSRQLLRIHGANLGDLLATKGLERRLGSRAFFCSGVRGTGQQGESGPSAAFWMASFTWAITRPR
jgi:hypothetical protein